MNEMQNEVNKLTQAENYAFRSFISYSGNKQKPTIMKIIEEFDKQSYICMHPDCGNITQKACHLLQKKRTLIHLTKGCENNILYRVQMEHLYRWDMNSLPKMEIKTISINEALSSQIFCNYHDNKIFESIEKSEPDFTDYKTLILCAYRAVCAELKSHRDKLTMNNLHLKEQINDKAESLKRNPPAVHKILLEYYFRIPEDGFKQHDQEYKHTISTLGTLKISLEQEISGVSNQQFIFKVRKIKQLPIAVSSVLGSEYQHVTPAIATPYIFLAIPYHSYTFLIMGYCKSFSDNWIINTSRDWGLCGEEELQRICSIILLRIIK